MTKEQRIEEMALVACFANSQRTTCKGCNCDVYTHSKRLVDLGYGNLREFAGKVKPIIGQLVEMLFDDNVSKCKVECHKEDDMPCGASVCVEENKEYWNDKIDELLQEYENG